LGDIYKFSRVGKEIYLNETPLIIGKYDAQDEQYMDTYNETISDGHTEDYARIKAVLIYAPYCEIGISSIFELMDLAVLYLLGRTSFPHRTDPLSINVDHKYRVNGTYKLPSSGSDHATYDYDQLFINLLHS
jgi:hypothetical protein